MRLTPRSALLVLSFAALSACVSAPAPTPTPAPAPAPRQTHALPPAPVAENWMDAPATTGDWRWQGAAGTSTATFTDASGQALLSLRCDKAARAVDITRYNAAGTVLELRTETQDRLLPATGSTAATARVPAADPLLDAVAFSRGRFFVNVAGAQPLYVPSFPEITRVVEDCR